MTRSPLILALSLVFAPACGGGAVDAPAAEASTPAAEAAPADSAGGLELGDWTAYPDPPGEELDPKDSVPLDDDRWARVSAELACAGRVERGDAGAHRLAARRVLHFHKTTAKAVMDYGIAVNLDPARAARLSGLVADASERCR